MIVRIQGEGQWEVSGHQIDELDKIDGQIVDLMGSHDQARFESLLAQMLDHVRRNGRKLSEEQLSESDLILPPADATMDEVKELFSGEGLMSS